MSSLAFAIVVLGISPGSADASARIRQAIHAEAGIEYEQVHRAIVENDAEAIIALFTYAKRTGLEQLEKSQTRITAEQVRACEAAAADRKACIEEQQALLRSTLDWIRGIHHAGPGRENLRARLYVAALIFVERVSSGYLDRCERSPGHPGCLGSAEELDRMEDMLLDLVETARGLKGSELRITQAAESAGLLRQKGRK